MEQFKVVTELDREQWSKFVLNHPNGNIFQTPEMFDVYENTKNWLPIFLAVSDSANNIVGILVAVVQKEFGGFFGKFTARAICWGGPLIKPNENKSEIIDLLLKALDRNLERKIIYAQFRNLWEFCEEKKHFTNNGYTYEDHIDYQINLTLSQEELFNNMSKNRKKNIRRVLNNDLQVTELGNLDNIEIFYNLLKTTYKRVKHPYPSLNFFKNAFRFLWDKGMISFFLVSQKDKTIAGRAVLIYRNTVYDWYAGTSKEAFSLYGNDLLIWKILLWSKKKGCKLFDFGGAGSPYEYYGPGEYKRRFGGKEINFGRFEKPYKKIPHWIIKNTLNFRRRGLYDYKSFT